MRVALILCLLLALKAAKSFNTEMRKRLHDATNFLDQMQNSKCDDKQEYVVIEIGDFSYGGGFASQFQLAALFWLRTAAHLNYSKPILIRGHIRSYSDGKECESVNHDWTCFFKPLSSCQEKLLVSGTLVSSLMKSPYDDLVPVGFADMGVAWWWGVVQLYLFRLQPHIEELVLHEASKMSEGLGFPFDSLIAGLHVRHGDKSIDGWRLHSFENEMAAVRKSRDCLLDPSITSTSTSDTSSSLRRAGILRRSLEHHTEFHQHSSTDGEGIGAGTHAHGKHEGSHSVAGHHTQKQHPKGVCHPNVNNVTDSHPSERFLHVFVASDDPNVLSSAHQLGHLVDSSGVSQKTGTTGMVNVLSQHPEYGYNATVEIITDIYFLSKCSTLVGTAASQVFRMAVGISYANSTLTTAIALDYSQLGRIRKMSMKYQLIVPENFESP